MSLQVKYHPSHARRTSIGLERQRKLAIKLFEARGEANHSSGAYLLPFVIEHCEKEGIPYRLTAYPGNGYYIEKISPL